jgi:hypothetical protein
MTIAKLLFGLVKIDYKADFAGGKSPNIQKIITDLQIVDIRIDDETLRRHLRSGSEAAAKDH